MTAGRAAPPRSHLEELMSEHRITLMDLQLAAGVGRSTLQRIRAGGSLGAIRAGTLAKISAALGLAVVEVFPVLARAPRRTGLIAQSLRARERRRRALPRRGVPTG